ncbi:TauD/TfdA family dioxygenase [Aquimarina litoralis]|uniref:TauD/TfdA family dioxygenase n=1 Tax=Aquimarina litoralis TaxID=584605 RepID=UPI001C55AFC4|nr:TauD/TfdA family dioxygenase [Aquimarina litoralis]MBW1295665.1 TauD/TfdA family dioxygenase [Aquimarina litoralis]
MKNRLNKLKNISAKKVPSKVGVSTSFLDNDLKFPLVLKPETRGINLEKWIVSNKELFNDNLYKYGAILCRGFEINTVEKFQSLMQHFSKDLLEYKMRSSPRFELTNNVYVSTTHPKDQVIHMHSESSYAPNHPERITFCCIQEPMEGGETPIADNRMIFNFLNDELRDKFLAKEVQYRRNLNKRLGLPWQEAFQTDDKKEVEKECIDTGINFNWINEDELEINWTKKAVWSHPVTDEKIWFNHALFFNKHLQNEDILNSIVSDNELPFNTFYGDGSEISIEDIEVLKDAYNKATTKFSWEKGDVLFLDNLLFSHGRNSYSGDRKIIVSIS